MTLFPVADTLDKRSMVHTDVPKEPLKNACVRGYGAFGFHANYVSKVFITVQFAFEDKVFLCEQLTKRF